MKNSSYIEPDIFDLFGMLDIESQAAAGKEDYLHREDVITSLAKERFQRELKAVTFSGLEEKLFSLKMPDLAELRKGKKAPKLANEYVQKVGTTIVRPILRSMQEPFMEDSGMRELMRLVDARYGFDITVSDVPLTYVGRTAAGTKGEQMIKLTLREEGFPLLVLHGTKLSVHPAGRRNVLFKNGTMVADLAHVLAWLIVLSQVQKEVERQKNLSDMEKGEDVLYSEFRKVSDEEKKELLSDIRIELSTAGAIPSFSLEDVEICTCSSYRLNPSVMEHIRNHVSVKVFSDRSELVVYYKQALQEGKPVWHLQGTSQFLALGVFALDGEWINYRDLLVNYNNTDVFPYPHFAGYSSCAGLFVRLYDLILSEKGSKIRTAKYLRELASDYAKSYQSKKNIPEKVVEAMRTSGFNTHFGYVEFDESVDLDKVDTVQKEFEAVWEKYLGFIDSTKNALRFRLLGNHKASGLYYPHIKCMCVDVRYPHSFLHEYGHLIDYEYGHLSMENSFYPVRTLYKEYLLEQIRKGGACAEQLQGKTKYNLDYYLEPTEIFARSFELYMAKVKGVRNSLLPETFGWEYPPDEMFFNAVGDYFDRMFRKLSKEETAA